MKKSNRRFKLGARKRSGGIMKEFTKGFKKLHPTDKKYISRKRPTDAWAELESLSHPTKVRMRGAEKLRGKLLAKDNFGERMAQTKLKRIGAIFEREYPVRVSKKLFFIDFFVKSIKVGEEHVPLKIALEVDGSIHNEDHVIERDKEKNAALLSLRYVNSVLRITVPKMTRITHDELRAALLNCAPGVTTLEYPSCNCT